VGRLIIADDGGHSSVADQIGFDHKAEVIGYTTIGLSFLLVFFDILSYRDNIDNGQITFTKAFTVGILVTLISCLFYVTWEILYFNLPTISWTIQCSHDRQASSLWRPRGRNPGATSGPEKIQRNVGKPALQLTHYLP
jgi:uncharacterized protein DUF4199